MKLSVTITRIKSGSYRASCPALPGCMVYATSEREAQARIASAIRGYMVNLDVVLPKELDRLAHTGLATASAA